MWTGRCEDFFSFIGTGVIVRKQKDYPETKCVSQMHRTSLNSENSKIVMETDSTLTLIDTLTKHGKLKWVEWLWLVFTLLGWWLINECRHFYVFFLNVSRGFFFCRVMHAHISHFVNKYVSLTNSTFKCAPYWKSHFPSWGFCQV